MEGISNLCKITLHYDECGIIWCEIYSVWHSSWRCIICTTNSLVKKFGYILYKLKGLIYLPYQVITLMKWKISLRNIAREFWLNYIMWKLNRKMDIFLRTCNSFWKRNMGVLMHEFESVVIGMLEPQDDDLWRVGGNDRYMNTSMWWKNA